MKNITTAFKQESLNKLQRISKTDLNNGDIQEEQQTHGAHTSSSSFSIKSDPSIIQASRTKVEQAKEVQDAMPAENDSEQANEIKALVQIRKTINDIAQKYDLGNHFKIYDEKLEERFQNYQDGMLTFDSEEIELDFKRRILNAQIDWKLDQLSKLAIANKKYNQQNIFGNLAQKYIKTGLLSKESLRDRDTLQTWIIVSKLDLLNKSLLRKESAKITDKTDLVADSLLEAKNPLNFALNFSKTLANRVEQVLNPKNIQAEIQAAPNIEVVKPIQKTSLPKIQDLSFIEEKNQILAEIKKNDEPKFKGMIVRVGRSPSIKDEDKNKNHEYATIKLEADSTISRNQLDILFDRRGGFSIKNLSSNGTKYLSNNETEHLYGEMELKTGEDILIDGIKIKRVDNQHLIIGNKVLSNKNGRAILISEDAEEYYSTGLGAYPDFEFSQRDIGDCYLLAALYTGMKFGVINIDRMIDIQPDGNIHVYIPKLVRGRDGQEYLSYREKPPIIVPADADVGKLNRKCYDRDGDVYYKSPLEVHNVPKSLEEKIQIVEYAYGKKVKMDNIAHDQAKGYSVSSLNKLRLEDTRIHMSGGSSKTALSELIGGDRSDIPRVSLNTVEPDSIDFESFKEICSALTERYGRFTFTAGVNGDDEKPFGAKTYRDEYGSAYADPDLRYNRRHAYAAELFVSSDETVKVVIRNPHLTDLNNDRNRSNDPKSLVVTLDTFYKYFDRFYFCDTNKFEKLMALGEGSKALTIKKDEPKALKIAAPKIAVKNKVAVFSPEKLERAKAQNLNKTIHIENQINGLIYIVNLLNPSFKNFDIESLDLDQEALDIILDGEDYDRQVKSLMGIINSRFSKLARSFNIDWDRINSEVKQENPIFYKSNNDSEYIELLDKVEQLTQKISNKYEPTEKAGDKDLISYHRSMAQMHQKAPGVPDISHLGFLCYSAQRIYQMSTLVKQGYFDRAY